MGGNTISLSLSQRVLSSHFETVVLLDCSIAYDRHFYTKIYTNLPVRKVIEKWTISS